MRTNSIKPYIILTAAILAFGACDVLNQTPEDRITETNFWNTVGDAEAGVISIYDRVQSLAVVIPTALEVAADGVTAIMVEEDYLPIDQHQITVDNPRIRELWEFTYSGINRANDALKNIPTIDDPALTIEKRENLLGEALFLRAYFYYHLVHNFGDVPLILQPYDSFNANFTVPRTPQQVVWRQIVDDLNQASATLPYHYADAMQTRGRATKGAAAALLAKVHLQLGELETSMARAQEVIENPNYSLVEGADAYARMFRPDGRNSSESIWEIQFLNATAEGHGLHRRFMPVANQGQMGGQYLLVPTPAIMDAYLDGDIRRNAAFRMSTNPPFRNNDQPYVAKYIRTQDNQDPNIVALRLADILLIKAEAHAKLGQTADAKALLDRIRRRAYGVDLNLSSSSDYPSDHDQQQHHSLAAAIAQERFVELAFEGHRWYDLKRNNQATVVFGISAWQQWWPVPQRERDVNPLLEQNQGYN